VKQIAIIGGGISGLSAANFLTKAGHACTLIEKQERLGGVIRTEEVDGCLVEAGPDSFIAEKPWAMELIRELGLADEVIGSNDHLRRTYVLRRGRLVPLPDGVQFMVPTKIMPLVTTGLLILGAKEKMGLEWFRRPRGEQPDRTVAEFVTDHYGAEVNEYLAQPMLAGVYGGEPENLSVNSVLPRFVELEKRHGSLTKGVLESRLAAARKGGSNATGKPRSSLFLTLKGGMQQLTDALVNEVQQRLTLIRAAAESVERAGDGFAVRANGQQITADEVVIAAPAYEAARVIRNLEPKMAEPLAGIGYSSSITVALLYHRPPFDHPLNGFGILVPRAEGRPIAACTWVNTKFPFRAAENRALLRGFFAGAKADDAMARDDSEIAGVVHRELQALMGFRAEPATYRIHRWQRAMAQYEVGHQKRLGEIVSRLAGVRGLHLAGNGYTGIGIPDCIRRSREIAEAIAAGTAGR
jgi:oxygen-dependent protoporphyrinogen oxidase